MSNAYFQAAMSEYLAEEARAADMAPLHEQMFGHALEPDPDFSCNGVDTDYPGGPLVIEKSGADEAVRAVEREMHRGVLAPANDSLTDWQRRTRRTERCDMHGVVYRPGEACGLCCDAALHDSGLLYDEPAADLSAITRDIARGG